MSNTKLNLEEMKSEFNKVLESGFKFVSLRDAFHEKYEKFQDEMEELLKTNQEFIDLDKKAKELIDKIDL